MPKYCALFGLWLAVNLKVIPGIPPFDPSLVILAMAASVEAIFLITRFHRSRHVMASGFTGKMRANRHVVLRWTPTMESASALAPSAEWAAPREIRMKTTNEFSIGRVLLLQCNEALDGSGLTPEQITEMAQRGGLRYLLVDTTPARYADSGGLRWLLRLREVVTGAGKRLRIVARPGGKVWRNIQLLETDLEVYPSVARAWKDPWEGEKVAHPRRTAARA